MHRRKISKDQPVTRKVMLTKKKQTPEVSITAEGVEVRLRFDSASFEQNLISVALGCAHRRALSTAPLQLSRTLLRTLLWARGCGVLRSGVRADYDGWD